ncbi:MAG TPA: pyridoxal-phosphate dependent enzyme [Cyclobacteriaceae bacterium]|nr:pyridoxal-phosphate dependent enzyme [Cyclobacteriaceae bacterium]
MAHLTYTRTPVTEVHDPVLERAGVRVLVKREDLNHPYVSGNKWWKLKYNIVAALQQQHDTLLTFGGAYSNHLYATAAAARELGLKSIAIVRGEMTLPLNPTLSFVRECGMQLHYVSRERYRDKATIEFQQWLQENFDRAFVIPEGGTNDLAIKGCGEFSRLIQQEVNFDFIALPVGTGGTLAGIISGLHDNQIAVGYSVLKGGEFLHDEVARWLTRSECIHQQWRIVTAYHQGGYGKKTAALMQFMQQQQAAHRLPLDHVYTGKLCFGLWQEIEQGIYPRGSTILMLHTGGLQGTLSK